MMKRRAAILLAVWILVLSAACGTTVSVPEGTPAAGQESKNGNLKVHFLDVGQADCILIEDSGAYMLVDAGNNDDGDMVVDYLHKAGVKKLDYVIGTHPHEDHIGSLDTVIDNFEVKRVILPKVSHTTRTYEDVLTSISNKNLKITEPKVGDAYELGDSRFTIIAPNGDYGDDLNNWSVGIRLVYEDTAFVFAGDAESGAEHDICSNGQELKADVLKLGHHGSSTSSSDEFLEKTDPDYAVIMCGKDNDYGHPHRETLEKMKRYGISVFRTDEQGTLIAESDGKTILWNAEPVISGIEDTGNAEYILNTNTKKFHRPDCKSVGSMSEENKKEFNGSREQLVDEGYSPCGTCKP